MERKYRIYKITSPSGRSYVGLTSVKPDRRWQEHRSRSETKINHPFYNAIRKYSAENFQLTVLIEGLTKNQAQSEEKRFIAMEVNPYNVSKGGEADGSAGGRIFWDRMNANPEAKKQHLKKLSDVKKKNDWTDYNALAVKNKAWRKQNPKVAYKKSRRACRIATKVSMANRKPTDTPKQRTLKEKLIWKHNRSAATRLSAKALWQRRTQKEKEVVFNKISESTKKRFAGLSLEDKRALTQTARSSIDRSKQGPAASKGIKEFWVELKKDPVKYKEYMTRRTATLKATLNA